MSTLRFTLVAAGLFALTFVGVSWRNLGFPGPDGRRRAVEAGRTHPDFR
jgi:hypothetical protein